MTATLSCDAHFYSESGEDLGIALSEIQMGDAHYIEDGAYLGKGTPFSHGEKRYEITSVYTRLAFKSGKVGPVLEVVYVVRPV